MESAISRGGHIRSGTVDCSRRAAIEAARNPALAEAASITGSRLDLTDMPHYKNLPVLSSNPVAKVMFGPSGSGPGLKLNNIAPFFMGCDKAALKRWLAAEFEKAPPS